MGGVKTPADFVLHPDCIGFEVMKADGTHHGSQRFYDKAHVRDEAFIRALIIARHIDRTIRQQLRGSVVPMDCNIVSTREAA